MLTIPKTLVKEAVDLWLTTSLSVEQIIALDKFKGKVSARQIYYNGRKDKRYIEMREGR